MPLFDLILAFERYAEEDPHYEAELKQKDKKLGKPEHEYMMIGRMLKHFVNSQEVFMS